MRGSGNTNSPPTAARGEMEGEEPVESAGDGARGRHPAPIAEGAKGPAVPGMERLGERVGRVGANGASTACRDASVCPLDLGFACWDGDGIVAGMVKSWSKAKESRKKTLKLIESNRAKDPALRYGLSNLAWTFRRS